MTSCINDTPCIVVMYLGIYKATFARCHFSVKKAIVIEFVSLGELIVKPPSFVCFLSSKSSKFLFESRDFRLIMINGYKISPKTAEKRVKRMKRIGAGKRKPPSR